MFLRCALHCSSVKLPSLYFIGLTFYLCIYEFEHWNKALWLEQLFNSIRVLHCYIHCEIRSGYLIASCLVTPQKFCSCSHQQSAGQVNSSTARCPKPGVQISLAKFCRNKTPTHTIPLLPWLRKSSSAVHTAQLERINLVSSPLFSVFALQIFFALQLSNIVHKLDILDKCPLAPSFSLASASLKYNLFGEHNLTDWKHSQLKLISTLHWCNLGSQ